MHKSKDEGSMRFGWRCFHITKMEARLKSAVRPRQKTRYWEEADPPCVNPSDRPSVRPSVRPPACLPDTCQPACLRGIFLSAHQPARQQVSQSANQPACLSMQAPPPPARPPANMPASQPASQPVPLPAPNLPACNPRRPASQPVYPLTSTACLPLRLSALLSVQPASTAKPRRGRV